MEQDKSKVIKSYDDVAANYASKFLQELAHKPLDRLLLEDIAKSSGKKGTILDLGCGPGQTTQFLHQCGAENVLGTDISAEMIHQAQLHAQDITIGLSFEVADMLSLQYSDNTFSSAIAFYSIVNLSRSQLPQTFREIHRVLQPGGQFLFSFHVGTEIVHLESFLETDVDLSFYFFDPDDVHTLLREVGFKVMQSIIRYPYEGIEHPSKRAYITAVKSE